MKRAELVRRVALYRSPYDSYRIWECGPDPDKVSIEGYVRVSEVLEITVTPLPHEEIVAGQMRALYALRSGTEQEFRKRLEVIDGKIADLRALPAPKTV